MTFCHIFKVGGGGGFFKQYQNEVYFCYLYIKTPPLQLQEFKNSIKKIFIITIMTIIHPGGVNKGHGDIDRTSGHGLKPWSVVIG